MRYFFNKQLFNGAKFTTVLQLGTSMTHIRSCYFFFWDQNTTGHISSRTAHKYEGIRTTPLTKLALLSSVFLILGAEIKDAAKYYTEWYYFWN